MTLSFSSKPQLSHDSSDSYLEMLRENNPCAFCRWPPVTDGNEVGEQGRTGTDCVRLALSSRTWRSSRRNPDSHLQLRRAIGWVAAGSQGQFRRIGQFKSAAQATASTAKVRASE